MPNPKHEQFDWNGIELQVDELTATGPVNLAVFAVAGVPDATLFTGGLIYVSNGAAGAPVVAFSDGTDWLRVDTLAEIAAA